VLGVNAIVIESRVAQLAVAIVTNPVVVTRAWHAVVAHVPLADVRGLVAQFLQFDVIVGQPVTHRAARDIVDDAVPARILTGHDRRAIGRADRRGMEGPLEQRTLERQPIDVRRLHVWVAARAELVVAQVVDQDDEEVRLLSHRFSCSGIGGFRPPEVRSCHPAADRVDWRASRS
jgi:hypothetical protein